MAQSRVKVIGSYVSPYVRKVMACIHLKGLDYEIDPITAFFGGDEFERLSPLRRIPVLVDGGVELSDSSVICAYLDEAYPDPPLLPQSSADRARARWFEEYADTRLGDVLIWGLFYQKVVHPIIWGEPGDADRVARTLAEDLPREMRYLESQAPADDFLFGRSIGLADIAVASFFRNGAYAGVTPDPGLYPRLAGWIDRSLAEPCFETFMPFERTQMRTDPKGRRKALLEAGAPLTAETLGTREARKGIMKL